jgi:xylan 1,4-beta-xylosidase
MHTPFTRSLTCVLLLFLQFSAYSQINREHIKTAENRYSADLGNGTYLNPVLKGNYADPSVVRDGEDYYLTHSSFDNIPGLTVWHSKDLVNWTPIANALTEFVGGVWAPDIIKFKDRFYIYFPAGGKNWVVTATNPAGPWSRPVDLKIGGIDPGHLATPDGKRYLYLNDGRMAPLSDDGMSVTGPERKIYEGWQYPKDWITECFCLESPKLTYRKGYYYMTAAQGGTAGPPTSHMVVSARSKTPFGPWENSPNNPIIRNADRNNKWASTGHGTLVDSPDGKWWMIFHGFEAADRTLGRQILLSPIEWTKDGWFKVPKGADPAKPLKKPVGKAVSNNDKLSDDFAGTRLKSQWNILKNQNTSGFRVSNNTLSIKGIGGSIENTQPLTLMPANNSYEVSVNISKGTLGAKGGLVLYYNSKYYVGLEFADNAIYRLYNGGRGRMVSGISQDNVYLRLVNDHHDLLCYYSLDGKEWKRMEFVTETSGYHHNILGDWGYLRPALFATGDGEVQFRNFQYQGLN